MTLGMRVSQILMPDAKEVQGSICIASSAVAPAGLSAGCVDRKFMSAQRAVMIIKKPRPAHATTVLWRMDFKETLL